MPEKNAALKNAGQIEALATAISKTLKKLGQHSRALKQHGGANLNDLAYLLITATPPNHQHANRAQDDLLEDQPGRYRSRREINQIAGDRHQVRHRQGETQALHQESRLRLTRQIQVNPIARKACTSTTYRSQEFLAIFLCPG